MANLIGTGPNQVPTNGDLGSMAFQDKKSVSVGILSVEELRNTTGTANGVAYLNGSKVLTTGSVLTFDGTTFTAPTSVITSSSTTSALRITQTGTGNALVVEDSENPDSSPFVINSGGNVIAGTTATSSFWYTASNTPRIFTVDNSATSFGYASIQYNGAGAILLGRSNGTNIGDRGIVADGNTVGLINFTGDDGLSASTHRCAAILAQVDGSPGTNSMPGRLIFQTTPSGSATAVEHLRISQDGIVDLRKNNTAGTALNIIRFTDTDTTAAAGQDFGQIQFYSSDSSGAGVKAYIKGKAVDTNTGGYLEFGASANTAGVNATAYAYLSNTTFSPITDNTIALGTSAIRYTNCYTNAVSFPVTQVASADANTLDDYEEGTFTPTVEGDTTTGTCNYTAQQARYTKIGRVLYFNLFVGFDSHTGSGTIRVNGLPFAQAANSGNPIYVCRIGTLTATYNEIRANSVQSQTYINLGQYNNVSGGLSDLKFESSGVEGTISISGFYQI